MKTGLFITVRSDSTRLPNKALIKIGKKTTLDLVIMRATLTKQFDEIIVCTTRRKCDDCIVNIARKYPVKIYRGSNKDKLKRWLNASKKYLIDIIVTMDADDLFCEPTLMDKAVIQMRSKQIDFIKSPKMLVVGAFSYALSRGALEKVCEIKNTIDTEMMWVYFEDTGLFCVEELENVNDNLLNKHIRLTLDYPEDLKFFDKIFENLCCYDNRMPLEDIIAYLDKHKELTQINWYRQNDFINNQINKIHLDIKGDIYQ